MSFAAEQHLDNLLLPGLDTAEHRGICTPGESLDAPSDDTSEASSAALSETTGSSRAGAFQPAARAWPISARRSASSRAASNSLVAMPPPSYSRAPLSFSATTAQEQLQGLLRITQDRDFISAHVSRSATHPSEGIDAVHPAAGCLGAGHTLKHTEQALIAGALLLNASQQRTPAVGPYEVHLPCPWEAPAHTEGSSGHMVDRAAEPSPSTE